MYFWRYDLLGLSSSWIFRQNLNRKIQHQRNFIWLFDDLYLFLQMLFENFENVKNFAILMISKIILIWFTSSQSMLFEQQHLWPFVLFCSMLTWCLFWNFLRYFLFRTSISLIWWFSQMNNFLKYSWIFLKLGVSFFQNLWKVFYDGFLKSSKEFWFKNLIFVNDFF